jgi:hypothetical protein
MKTYSDTHGLGGKEPPSFGIGNFLFTVVLVFILVLLAQCMVRRHFFGGRRVNQPTPQAPIPIGP